MSVKLHCTAPLDSICRTNCSSISTRSYLLKNWTTLNNNCTKREKTRRPTWFFKARGDSYLQSVFTLTVLPPHDTDLLTVMSWQGCGWGLRKRCLPLGKRWVTSPGCPAIVGSVSHLSVPDEFVLHGLVSQRSMSTTGEQAAVVRLRV